MRKNEMKAVIGGLKARITALEEQRDGLIKDLHGKADSAATAIGKLGDDVAGFSEAVRGDLKAHTAAVANHGKTLAEVGKRVSGLAEAVRSAAPTEAPAAVAEPEAAPVTPIARGTKAAG